MESSERQICCSLYFVLSLITQPMFRAQYRSTSRSERQREGVALVVTGRDCLLRVKLAALAGCSGVRLRWGHRHSKGK